MKRKAALHFPLIALAFIHDWQSSRVTCYLSNAAEKLTAPVSIGNCFVPVLVALLLLTLGVLAWMQSPLFICQNINSISDGFTICSVSIGISVFSANRLTRISNRRLIYP